MFQGEGHSRRGPKFNTARCHFESNLAVKMYNETSGRVTWLGFIFEIILRKFYPISGRLFTVILEEKTST